MDKRVYIGSDGRIVNAPKEDYDCLDPINNDSFIPCTGNFYITRQMEKRLLPRDTKTNY